MYLIFTEKSDLCAVCYKCANSRRADYFQTCFLGSSGELVLMLVVKDL